MTNPIIAFRNVSKVFEDSGTQVLKDINFELEEGKFCTLLGASGSGKSTILNIIAGLLDATSGDVLLDGKRINDIPINKRDVHTVFQSYALFPHMNVFDNVAFALKLKKVPKKEIEERVEEALKMVQLNGYQKRSIQKLSGGQRQRVAMGRAIVRDAKVFLMDEPLSNLDAKLRVSMRAEIAKIHRRIGATTIYVTHDQTEAMTLADRIVIMSATKNPAGTGTIGRVEQIGTPQEVYKNPVNKFVAGFIGSPAMNFINVKLEGGYIVANGLNLKVPEGALKVLREKGYDGKEIIFGIRPEDVNTEAAFLETFPESVVKATISVSELLGSESHLYCQVGDNEFIAKVDARDYLGTGETIELGFDLNKAHFFDKETEKTVY